MSRVMTIREEMDVHGVSIADVARESGMPYVPVRKQLDLRVPLTPHVAAALVKLVGHTADYWNALSELLRAR